MSASQPDLPVVAVTAHGVVTHDLVNTGPPTWWKPSARRVNRTRSGRREMWEGAGWLRVVVEAGWMGPRRPTTTEEHTPS